MFARPKTYIININPKQQLDEEEVGSSGIALGELADTGVMMPDSFIVTSTAFDDFITSANIVEDIAGWLDEVKDDNPETLRQVSEEISKVILGANIPSLLLNPIIQAYKQLSGLTDKYISVQPSWILSPDLIPDYSDYIITDIRGEGAYLYAIKQAWTALFSPEALELRHKSQYQGGLSMAVVVQKEIQPEVSGIAYSADPHTFDEATIYVEAILGILPQTIEPDLHADLYKIDAQKLEIIEKHILEQSYMLIRKGRSKDGESPIVRVDISSEWRRKQKLEDSVILSVAEITKILANRYGHPVEVNWNYETGNLYVTALMEMTKIELAKPDLARLFEEAEAGPKAKLDRIEPSESRVNSPDLDSLVSEVNQMLEETIQDQPTITPDLDAVVEQEPIDINRDGEDEDAVDEVVEQLEHEVQNLDEIVEQLRPIAAQPNQAADKNEDQTEAEAMENALAELPEEVTEMPAEPVVEPAPGGVIPPQPGQKLPQADEPEVEVEPESIVDDGASIMDKLPPELRARIEEAAANAPKAEAIQENPEPEPEPVEQKKSIVDEIEIAKSEVRPIRVTQHIKETYNMNTNIFLDISPLDSGTLTNGSNFDGVFLDGTAMVMRHRILPESLKNDQEDLKKLIEAYALEISTAAKAVGNKPMIYAFSDISDKERKELLGQVPTEAGLDGSERFVLQPEALIAEVLAVKKAKSVYGANNLKVMMPKLRTEIEVVEMKKIMNSQNFTRTSIMQLFAEVATPSFLYELEHTEGTDLDGVIVNFPKLAKGMTGRSEFVARDHKPILSATKLMLDFNRKKQFTFMLYMNDNPDLVRATFEAKVYPSAFIFADIPSEDTFEVIKSYELAPLSETKKKRGRKPKELKSKV